MDWVFLYGGGGGAQRSQTVAQINKLDKGGSVQSVSKFLFIEDHKQDGR